ncbi:glycoside hydrolase family 9 protein [Streptomyces morookaense]|uniref:Glycoside hydrolase family 9 protein n=1 Tax=Streptomyces morookaense TaxID=1970 RepID=A0A7Y7EA06_STRMO|nr:glycoside hydrolase family 9 protein [Streptomyces morookaense]NVK80972.1 glycoside hydrolase family 9 protein [Streptomyces morookaense]GHF40924.1 hydrolase [Streptomyces morookaense]
MTARSRPRSRPRPRTVVLAVAAAVAAGAVTYALPARGSAPAADGPPAVVRVDQAGYAVDEAKQAFVMGPEQDLDGAGFKLVDAHGRTVRTGPLGPRTGRWNRTYTSVRTVDLSAVDTPGTYRIELTGTASGSSPAFTIAAARDLMTPLVQDNVRFFRAQRDGADVPADILSRKPSHLADRRATVHAAPHYDRSGKKLLDERLTPVGGQVDVSGGFFDAGDFLKFTHTTSYSVAELLLARRSMPGAAGLSAETRHGLAWLDRMWDGSTGTLYAQVGIGAGNDTVRTDHDVWRLPEADDALDVPPGHPDRTIKDRPVFRAAEPGAPISPNLAGRMAAVFALAAQQTAHDDPGAARTWLAKAAAVYEHADTAPSGTLVTVFPHAFYPEEVWQDDMEFGATELALAAQALGDDRADAWRRQAAGWAKAYLDSDDKGTLGVADVSALAHTDLLTALNGSGTPGISPDALRADLRRQLDEGMARAAKDPFTAGAVYSEADAVPHTFGLVATARLYAKATGDHRYDAFAARQRGWALGANPWGTSFMVGAGETFPHCPSHQVANLAGSLDGTGAILRGAVVNGPNSAKDLDDPDSLNTFPTMRKCVANPPGGASWRDFDGRGAGYRDRMDAWQTAEPALDFTSVALLAFALTAS